ncbi:MAG: TonB-dependent receptor [Bacteroidia bacterium]|nr:TonB-dependent receptor [Bacteroidia bacterium]
MSKTLAVIGLWLVITQPLFAQKTTDTLHLNEVNVSDKRTTALAPYAINGTGNASENIQQNTPYFVKQASPGMLATLSIRGSTASQINTVWNGVKINNAMLGQNDFSLLQGALFGNSALNESAASTAITGGLGGSVTMAIADSAAHWLKVQVSASTLNNTTQALQLRIGKHSIKSFTHINYTYNNNNYTYIDEVSTAQRLLIKQHSAHTKGANVYEELRYTKNKWQVITAVWYTYNNRHIPPTLLTANVQETQQDSSLRAMLNATYTFKKKQSISGMFSKMSEVLNYQNKQANIYSTNTVNTTAATLTYTKEWNAYAQRFTATSNNYSYTAITNNYSGKRHQYENTFALNYSVTMRSIRFSANALQTFINYSYTPTIASISANGILFRKLNYGIALGNNYRYPTLNDRYWSVGGNANLKPEYVHYAELKLNYAILATHRYRVSVGIYPYYKKLVDMIQWIPTNTNGIFTPQNIKSVAQYGYDTHLNTTINWRKFTLGINEYLGYNKSVVLQSTTTNDASVGRQLIYSPIVQLKTNATLTFNNNITLTYTHIYTSWRATSTDNYSFLPAYGVSNLALGYTQVLKKHTLAIHILAQNIFNANYAIVAYRPQTLRNYNIQLTYTL